MPDALNEASATARARRRAGASRDLARRRLRAGARRVPSGFPALDAVLPGRGWPGAR